MEIVTAADTGYFRYLLRLVTTSHGWLNVRPVVYDLGLTGIELLALSMMGIQTRGGPRKIPRGRGYPPGYTPRALHKPLILLDYCRQSTSDIIYMDADAWIVSPFEFPIRGIGVTRVRDKVVEAYLGSPLADYRGPHHSGVLFLGHNSQRLPFLGAWAADTLSDSSPSDKKSMNKVLTNYDFTVLDEDEWNASTMFPMTKIFHAHGGQSDEQRVLCGRAGESS
ncbi:hypothetical protein A3J33_01030 [candidate division WWE3 bacterium RIFCSPLOWO2_02_FULL_53_10]|uniref:Nucleotide-diphospho-sugar transferase domain-containing protein n=1 Tax=candidate division WWE3 bacterium RIFCSPLOWO2_02_FULL_53_10 TaxID=1802629 RepID=A0A1F4W5N2_UNCKA|nr:MAG: hypothetical protein A3J33_01030 [candidate division WWE3 bacterium RIFCSPLOWO2_02_FULL_53_10]